MEFRSIARQGRAVAIVTCCLLMGAWTVQSCKDEYTLTGQPSWLGNSIYERLQEDGNYTTLLRLVDDLEQTEVLSHSGSKTLFAANDSAFQAWFANNKWGVKNYSQLSTAQKKMLLNNTMINNPYLIELLSNVSGTPPLEGMCMRRETATTIYDSVEIISPDKMPATAVWQRFRDQRKSIPILKDATTPPMIHFLPKFMEYYNINSEDLAVLTNHQATSADEAWVNSRKVLERDITCKNGYIQRIDGVIEPMTNMAEVLRQHPQLSKWSALVDRFSAPYYNATATREYNRLFNNEDSVYTMRYLSKRSEGGTSLTENPDGEVAAALLTFDPGWNQYMYNNTMGYDLHYDAGAMIAPTNEALDTWWNNEGKDLQMEYGSWENVPNATLAKLINVNMLPTFTEAVPSKFERVLNDAKENLGIEARYVDSCFMACNGVVYMVNKVFSPAEYASVAYPALAHQSTMNVIYWAIDQLNFLPYLLSMDSRYSVLLPTNEALLWYLDPATYGGIDRLSGMEAPTALEFYYDASKPLSERVQARRFNTTVDTDGNIAKGVRTQATVDRSVIDDRLKRLMDDLIIVGDVEDGHEYYKTKGGSLIRVSRTADGRIAFSGGWQMEHNAKPLPVETNEIYPKDNGKSYQLNNEVPMGTQKSIYLTLKGNEAFSEFLTLIDNDGANLLGTKLNNEYNAGLSAQGSKNLTLLDNYNYTIYVPTNESIRDLIDRGLLPTWDDYEAMENEGFADEAAVDSAQQIIKSIIVNFIRYHVQDHSVAINMAPELYDEDLETGVKTPSYVNIFESMKRNYDTGRFFGLESDNSNGQLTVKDVMGNVRHVTKQDGLYNNICREYWFNGSGNTARIFMASDAVVHQIDAPLFYEEMTPWRELLKTIRRK
ncbi:fasciclin domain-containing protein [uncultured Prevotella sp.]|uniref:fasciclin domain-containing protein n=1 Tax=uncultured Prevotella sp. TaxID=159272 RepID=UPI0025FB524A|nr:fasciclin domain-containing protein [uncultured Prevotella sp.]